MCPLCDNTGYKKVYYDYGALCMRIFGKLIAEEKMEPERPSLKWAKHYNKNKEKWKRQEDLMFWGIVNFWIISIICGLLKFP